MFLVSVPKIFKIGIRASRGETISKVPSETFAFYKFVEELFSGPTF